MKIDNKGIGVPQMHVSDLQISPILGTDGTGTLEVNMRIKMPEGMLGRAAVTLRDEEENELFFHNMLLPGNMRMPMQEEIGSWVEIQAQMSPRNIGVITRGESEDNSYTLHICLYDASDRKIEEVNCPILFID